MNKTFVELGYNAGDTVRCVDSEWDVYTPGKEYPLEPYEGIPSIDGEYNGRSATWELVSRTGSTDATADGYLIWGDMTPEAQGALLLAEHNGAPIQYHCHNEWVSSQGRPFWSYDMKYRVKPADPVVVTHEIYGRHKLSWSLIYREQDTRKMTYNTIDGVIDCASVRMVELSDHTTE